MAKSVYSAEIEFPTRLFITRRTFSFASRKQMVDFVTEVTLFVKGAKCIERRMTTLDTPDSAYQQVLTEIQICEDIATSKVKHG